MTHPFWMIEVRKYKPWYPGWGGYADPRYRTAGGAQYTHSRYYAPNWEVIESYAAEYDPGA